jgi:hypothetical protein
VSNGSGKSADWRPDLPSAGLYDVYAWVPNHDNSTPAARYTITYATGTATEDISQQTGGMQWILLGRYQFAAGGTAHQPLLNRLPSNQLCQVRPGQLMTIVR